MRVPLEKRGDRRLTVVMPVRNAREFLPAAMKSILTQIERDFAFVIVDDGSTDGSPELAASLADSRTEVICDGRQMGVATRLNWGLDYARSKFVARMDADDIAAPHRLARQLAFMEAHPNVGICGSWYKVFGAESPPWDMRLPLDHERLRALTLFTSPFGHPTVMFRLKHLDKADLRYAENTFPAEDYDLWERARSKVVFANIPEFLHYYRFHPDQISNLQPDRQRVASDRVRERALLRDGVNPTQEELALHCDYAADHEMDRIYRLKAALSWLRRLKRVGNRNCDRALAGECAWRIRQMKRRIKNHADLNLPSRESAPGQLVAGWRRIQVKDQLVWRGRDRS